MQSLTTTILFLLFSLLPLLTQSLPTASVQHSKKFKLKSHVLSPSATTSSFENLYLEPYHIYPAFNYATLYPKTKSTPGIIGYLNGTRQEIEDDQGGLVFNLGKAGVYSFVIGG